MSRFLFSGLDHPQRQQVHGPDVWPNFRPALFVTKQIDRYWRHIMLKSVRMAVLGVSLSLISFPGLAQTGVNIEVQNPLQIATLHWYSANLPTTFTVGSRP